MGNRRRRRRILQATVECTLMDLSGNFAANTNINSSAIPARIFCLGYRVNSKRGPATNSLAVSSMPYFSARSLSLLCHYCRRLQDGRQIHFYPARPSSKHRGKLDLTSRCSFSTRDGVRLNGWFILIARPRSTWVWFHGNAGNISHRVENINSCTTR